MRAPSPLVFSSLVVLPCFACGAADGLAIDGAASGHRAAGGNAASAGAPGSSGRGSGGGSPPSGSHGGMHTGGSGSGGGDGTGGAAASGATAGAAGCGVEWVPQRSVSHETPEDALGVEIGDMDADGRSDVLVLIHGGVLVYRQAQGGIVAVPTAYDAALPDAWIGRDLELGAFDGDATPDLVIGTENDVLWLPGGAGGELLAPRRLNEQPLNSGGSIFHRIRLADIDADGHLDATLMATNAVDLATYFGDGRGGLRNAAFVMNDDAPLQDFALADVTADGRPDAVGLTTRNDLVSFENLGDQFDHEARPLARSIVDHFGHTVETGDVDGDGHLDLLVSGGGNQPASLVVLRSTNAFTTVDALESYEVPETVLAADVNGDGLTDALVAHGGWHRLGLYQQCAGLLRPERLFDIPYASHYEHSGLAVGDLDSDGCNDVAIADYNAGLTILYGSCTQGR